MDGSKTIEERKWLIKKCYRIIFNSNWSKKRFLNGLNNKSINSDKLLVFYQSAQKKKHQYFKKKEEDNNFCWKTK